MGLDTPVNKAPDGQITTRLREQILLVSRMEIRPSFRGARSASPESITTTGSMDSGPAPNGASRNDAGVCGVLRNIRGTTGAVGQIICQREWDYCGAATCARFEGMN
jgi:hypothetical protein